MRPEKRWLKHLIHKGSQKRIFNNMHESFAEVNALIICQKNYMNKDDDHGNKKYNLNSTKPTG